MTHAITPAQFALPLPPMATDTPATACDCLLTSKAGCGFAKPTATKPTDVCARLLAWERVLWMQRAASARKAHRCSAGCLIEVKRLTHEILKQKEIQ